MKIAGFQKLTLLDYPGKVACILFTNGCNFACPFCHNSFLVTSDVPVPEYSEEEIFNFLKKRQGVLDGVCISGGEPLLHGDLPEFIKKIKELGYPVKLDTNGSMPEKLRGVVQSRLVDYVAMDIKNTFDKYPETTGCENINTDNIKESIDFLMKGYVDFEFRTTVVKEFHSPQDIEKISEIISGCDKYYLQNFVDSGNILGNNLHPVDENTLREMKLLASKNVKTAQIRGLS